MIALGTATAPADGPVVTAQTAGLEWFAGRLDAAYRRHRLGRGTDSAKVVPASRPASNRAALTVTGVRFGHHVDSTASSRPAGKGTPGWYASYTKNPKSPSSGKPVSIHGRSILEVQLTGLGYPADTGVKPYSGPNRSRASTRSGRCI